MDACVYLARQTCLGYARMTGNRLLRALERRGCKVVRRRGSPVRVACGRCQTTVPIHAGKDLPPERCGGSSGTWSRASGRDGAKMYTVRIARDETGAWIASVPSVPGCHTYGRSLRSAKRRIREALSLWVSDAHDADLRFRFELPASIRREIDQLTKARQRADDAARQAAVVSRRAVRRLLRGWGLSTRDAAELVGLSHQRVQQLLQG